MQSSLTATNDPPARSTRLRLVDCCRGFAAIFVVVYHGAHTVSKPKYFEMDPFDGAMQFGCRGVDFFFVLSGFIIAYVHWFDMGQSRRIPSYLTRRFVRVYPILWIVAIPLILANPPWKSMAVPTAWSETLQVLAGSLILLPTKVLPIPSVVWTLRHEVLFYAAFVIVIWRPRIGAAILSAWACLCVGHSTFGFKSTFYTDFLLNAYNLEFLLGVACGCFMRLSKVRFPVLVTIGGIACLSAACFSYEPVRNTKPWLTNATTGWQVVQFGLSSSLVVLGVSQIDTQWRVRVPKLLILLGSASYSIYLIHPAVISITCKALKLASVHVHVTPLMAFLAASLLGVLAGICLHIWVEVPLLRIFRRILVPFYKKPNTNAVSKT